MVTIQDGAIVPTFCGILLIGRKNALKLHMPTAEASIQVLVGTDIKVNESFYLPILAAFEKISDAFSAWNHSEEMVQGLFRITIPDYDPRAFREALVNAFCHRDYSVLGRVLVQINDEGMTISNPGGFIEGIRVDNLLDAEPHGRNPTLADAMKRIGLAERTGRGIDRIFEGSLLYGRLLPDYSSSTQSSVKLFIPKGPTDKAFICMVLVSDWGGETVKSLELAEKEQREVLRSDHEKYLDKIGMKREGKKIEPFCNICYASCPSGFVYINEHFDGKNN